VALYGGYYIIEVGSKKWAIQIAPEEGVVMGHYVVEPDNTTGTPGDIVVKTTDGPKGSEPQPLFWTTVDLVDNLIEELLPYSKKYRHTSPTDD